jgi:hypothetical protein
MKRVKLAFTAALLALSPGIQAAGPLLLNGHPTKPQPLRWDTSAGPVRVSTDIGMLTARDNGEAFLDNAQADKITAFAIKQWSDVATSTWRGQTDPAKFTKFSKVPGVGVDVRDGATAELVYGKPLEGGLYVIYDQQGLVVEEYFGVPRDQVLGIAFAEFADDRDGDGYPETITKATAVMNGYVVPHEPLTEDNAWMPPPDTGGKRIAGVFTHEFGHALNLSHSQVNGQLAYFSEPGWRDLYPGVKGCVAPVHSWASYDGQASRIDPRYIETMFPFIDPSYPDANGRNPGYEQSTVDRPDDMAALSDLYPSADYLKTHGSIAGTLFLKDGRNQHGGINIIARNVSDPMGDAISAMTGDKTQGTIGPDGRFRINNLKPGAKYVLYTEEIIAGGYPTEPMMLVSESEYWNSAEQANAASDTKCLQDAITAEAGVTKTANFYFNGYRDGVQYTPVVYGYLSSLSKDGSRAAGRIENTPFIWDVKAGMQFPPAGVVGVNASISRDGRLAIVQYDHDGKDVGMDWEGLPYKTNSATIWDSKTGRLSNLGELNGDTCGGSSQIGFSSTYGWAIDAAGETAVGTTYRDRNGDGKCEGGFMDDVFVGGEIVPFIWTRAGGAKFLSMDGIDTASEPWHRAHAVSGNGRVVLGNSNFMKAYAWIDQGKPIDLYSLAGASDGYAMTPDAGIVALSTDREGVVLWNATKGTGANAFSKMPMLKWCIDFDLAGFDVGCATHTPQAVHEAYGAVPVLVNSISDDGKVMVGQAGLWHTGVHGVMWMQDLGWIKLRDFFRTQGVAEAYRWGMDSAASLNGRGTEMIGGVAGMAMTWYVDMQKAFVCKNGKSLETNFPEGFVDSIKRGAVMGRCEHQQ